MTTRTRVFAVAGVLLAAATVAAVAQSRLPLVQLIPTDLKFVLLPSGQYEAPVVGDSSKPGLYAVRMRIPAGTRRMPHTHPDDRIVVVLGGTMYIGFGEQFDEQQLKAMPPGSVFTEPAKQPHFSFAKDGGVVLHVTGVGPTGTTELTK